MKLYIWKDVLRDDLPGVAFAMAHDVDEARRVILRDVEEVMHDPLLDELTAPPDSVIDYPAGWAVWGSS